MAIRLLDVTSYTTFDFVEGYAFGPDWKDESAAVVDVDRPKESPGTVRLQIEFDGGDLEHVEHHADALSLSPEQARGLAADLERHAANAEAEEDVPRGRGR
ncbi:hypothetical protein SAMN04488065_2085 [Haloplanus vescus]|uniref:Uncharacterized protein n=1 Tax=Haloplanus vescus TaxID=555874 RepID=A0A1H3Z2K8_9EURY|nr:DUF6360 family protein [Haloplanus vescus]SEA17574.1 hypothetical protein SAMN04488065_2085 [Haloplanus vescus]